MLGEPFQMFDFAPVGVAVALVALNFAWIYPVLTDGLLVHQTEYLARMWLRSWI